MTLNYIILGLIFFAGILLVTASLFNARFLFGETSDDDKKVAGSFFNPMGNISKGINSLFKLKNNKRTAYFFLGIVIIILGFVAIFFTGFLDEPIRFE